MQQMIQYNGKVMLLYSRLLSAAADGGDAAGGTFANRLTIFSRCGLKLRNAKLARQIYTYFACYAATRRRHRRCRILLFYFIRADVCVCGSRVCVCVCNAFLFSFLIFHIRVSIHKIRKFMRMAIHTCRQINVGIVYYGS